MVTVSLVHSFIFWPALFAKKSDVTSVNAVDEQPEIEAIISQLQGRGHYHRRDSGGRPTVFINVFFFMAQRPPGGPGPPHYRGFTITLRHMTLGWTPLDEWSTRHRETSAWRNTTLTTDRYSCPQRHSQQANSRRPTLQTRGRCDRLLY